MELSRKKQIKRRLLPGFHNGFTGLDYAPQYNQIRDKFNQQSAVNKYTVPLDENVKNISPLLALGALAGSGIAAGIGAVEQPNQLIANAGTTPAETYGIGYTKYNSINQNQIMDEYDTNMLSSIISNPFKSITMWANRNKQKELIKNAQIERQDLNTVGRTGTQTKGMQQNYYLLNGNPSNQVLYTAAEGKDESDTKVLPEVQNLYDAGALPLVTVSAKRRKNTGTYNTSSKSMLPSLSEMLKDNLQYLFMKNFGMLDDSDYLSYMHYNMLKNPRGKLLMPYFKYEDGKDLDGYTYDPALDNLVITPTEELNSVHKQNRENIKNAKQFIQDWTADRFWRNYDRSKNVLSYTDDPDWEKSQFADAQKRYLRSLQNLNDAIILTPDSEDDAFLYGTTKEQMLKNFEDEEETYGYYDPLSKVYGRPVIYLRNSSMDPNVVLHELTHASGLAYTDTPYTNYGDLDIGRENYTKDDIKWRLRLNDRYYNYLTGNDEPTARLSVLRKYLKDAGYDLHPDRDMTELELDAILNNSNIMNDPKVKDMNIFNMFYNGEQYDKKALLDFMNTAYTNPLTDVYRARRGKDNRMLTNPNSLVKRGESILSNLDPLNPQETTGTVVKQGSGRKDDVPANLGQKDIVLGEDIDWRTGSTFKQQALPYTMALEHINNKYENNGDGLSSLSKQTQKLQLEQVNRLKQPIVEKLKDLADQLKYQHNVTGYNQLFMAARGKDRTIPPLFPSAAMQELLDYYVTKYDKFVADYDDSYNYRNAYRDDYKAFTAPNAVKEYGQEAVDEAKSFANEEDYVNYFMKLHNDKKKKKSDNLQKVLDNNAWGKFLKLNKHAKGKDYHTIPNVLGALTSIGQSIEAAKQRVKTSDSYVPNTYGSRALNTLARLRINPYPIMRQVRDALSQADYALNNSGGLSGALKYLGRLANANNVYTNYAKLLSDIVTLNNQYTSQYATTAANLGLQDATRRQNANQWDLDYYSKAHAARLGGVLMGIRNLMDYINHWSSDASKLNQFNRMYNLYAVDTYSRANRPV